MEDFLKSFNHKLKIITKPPIIQELQEEMKSKFPDEPDPADTESEKVKNPFKFISLIKRLHVEYQLELIKQDINPFLIYDLPNLMQHLYNDSVMQQFLLNWWFYFRGNIQGKQMKRDEKKEKALIKNILSILDPVILQQECVKAQNLLEQYPMKPEEYWQERCWSVQNQQKYIELSFILSYHLDKTLCAKAAEVIQNEILKYPILIQNILYDMVFQYIALYDMQYFNLNITHITVELMKSICVFKNNPMQSNSYLKYKEVVGEHDLRQLTQLFYDLIAGLPTWKVFKSLSTVLEKVDNRKDLQKIKEIEEADKK